MKKNKVIILLSAIMFFAMIAQGQTYIVVPLEQPSELITDAGDNVVITVGNLIIGGNPTAYGGAFHNFEEIYILKKKDVRNRDAENYRK